MRIELEAISRLKERINGIFMPDATPLMATWMKIIADDNKKGVLAGTDRYGNPMEHVRYRPTVTKKGKGAKLTDVQRNGRTGRQRGIYGGFGPMAAGLHNNLTPAEYRKLDGPPLAPRGAFSRVITNLMTGYEVLSNGNWSVYGLWDQVVSVKSVAFLKYHFNGTGRLPVRDLRGVRPEGVEKARKAALAWMMDQIRSHRRAG